ncbi:YcxB family protein [Microlunatus speluncae]|uniref:YcxB family protein n=1 Tax=Microlunatus speluncae TaxID=2594267 RepID=UPI00126674D0|nr:YcxB family protein [Microlunatus speluncae]
MSEQDARARNSKTETHLLTPRPPVRAYAIAAAAAIAGAALIVAGTVAALEPVRIVGVVLLVLGAGLAIVALILVLRLSTTVIMDGAGIEVRRLGRRQRIPWSEVTSVKATRHHFIVVASSGGTEFVNPRDDEDRGVVAFMTAVRDRLDANRGYGS